MALTATSSATSRRRMNRHDAAGSGGSEHPRRAALAAEDPLALEQVTLEGLEGGAAMADASLGVAVDLGERATVGKVIEDRVVSESVCPGWLPRDLTLDHPTPFEGDAHPLQTPPPRRIEPGWCRAHARRAAGRSSGILDAVVVPCQRTE